MTLPSHPPHSYILCTSRTTHTAIGEPEGASLRQLGSGGGGGGREGGGRREEGRRGRGSRGCLPLQTITFTLMRASTDVPPTTQQRQRLPLYSNNIIRSILNIAVFNCAVLNLINFHLKLIKF